MLNVVNYEGKDKEEILEKILKELNCKKEDLFLKSEFIEGKLFKGSKYIVSVLKKKDVEKYIKEFFIEISNLMNINIESDVIEDNDIFNVKLVSDNNSILIGKDGRTLNSLQILIRQSLRNKVGLNIKLNLDVSNYKITKMKNIERLVNEIAKEVEETRLTVSLDSMNSYERRLVHTIVAEYPHLETISVGEAKDRHVTIKYKEE